MRRWAGWVPRVRSVLGVTLALVLLTACGHNGDIRSYLREEFGSSSRAGESETWQNNRPVGTVTAAIVGDREPLARRADGGNEYLRYDDDVVIVSAAPGGGSQILAEDLDSGRYRAGAFAYLGPGFSPGSPVPGDGGPGDSK